eukprot:scaffold22347_cov71-Phaeocystis_antarctica.AAC.2
MPMPWPASGSCESVAAGCGGKRAAATARRSLCTWRVTAPRTSAACLSKSASAFALSRALLAPASLRSSLPGFPLRVKQIELVLFGEEACAAQLDLD